MTTKGKQLPGLNSLITLEVGCGQDKSVYASRVESISPDKVVVAMPMERSELIALRPGTGVRVVYVNDYGVYGFVSEVASQRLDPVPVLTLVNLGNVKKMQRRHFLRVATTLFPIECDLLNHDSKKCRPIRIVIVNISGGGMQFVGDEHLSVGSMVRVRLDLPMNYGVVEAVVTVLRVKERPNVVRSCFETSGYYSWLLESDRDRICKYAVRKQLEQARWRRQ